MPVAHGTDVKRWLQDHDADMVMEVPPILNQWYTVFDAEDVRLLWCTILQDNDETNNKNIDVRWTIDGNTYLQTFDVANLTLEYIYKNPFAIAHPFGPLSMTTQETNAAFHVDKRGLSFKVEVRITSALGTNQMLYCGCVRETLEVT